MTVVDPKVAEIIRSKKMNYCLCADTGRWEPFKNVALPDATFGYYDADGTPMGLNGDTWIWHSRGEFEAYYQKVMGPMQTIHSVGSSSFEQVSPDEVKAIFNIMWRVGPKGVQEGHGTGGGYYYETWVRKDDDWFLKSLKFERTYWHT